MSEPKFFAFDLEKKRRIMIAHAVIFTSFECSSECELTIGNIDSDPRGKQFIEFVWSNYLKFRKERLESVLKTTEKEIAQRREELAQMKHTIQALSKEANEPTQS